MSKMRIGIRELEYELSAYEDNAPVVRLNYNPTAALQDGKPVFDAVKRKKRIVRFAIRIMMESLSQIY